MGSEMCIRDRLAVHCNLGMDFTFIISNGAQQISCDGHATPPPQLQLCAVRMHSTALRAEVRALFLLSGNVWLEALERCRVLQTCNNNGKDDGKQSVKYEFVVAKSCCVHPLARPQSTVATAAELYAAPGAGSSIHFSKSLCRCSRWDGGLFSV